MVFDPTDTARLDSNLLRRTAIDPQEPFGLRTGEWPFPEVQQPGGAVTAERSGALGASTP